jgi:hypothetical protein
MRLKFTSLPFFAVFFLAGSLLSCELINPEEPIPAYLYVKPFQFSAGSRQGSASHKITEVWVSADGDFLGAYNLPAVVPVLKQGKVNVRLEAGIRDNGRSATPEIYPFYQIIEQSIDLKPNRLDTLRPQISYKPGIKFAMIDDFESGTHSFQTLVTGVDASRMTVVSDQIFEGRGAGLIRLNEKNPSVELATTRRFSGFFEKGNAVYLELNYLSQGPVSFGVIGYKSGATAGQISYVAGFNPSDKWNKIYFNLSEAIASSKLDEYQIILNATLPKNENGTNSRTEADIRIDNIKLIYF